MSKPTVIMFRNTWVTFLVAVISSLSPCTSYGTDITKPFPFADVIKKMDWPGPEGSKIEGQLVCAYPDFVTVLAGTSQHKIPRRSLDAKQLQIVKMLDEEIEYLKTSILPDFLAEQQKPNVNAAPKYEAIKVVESTVNPEYAEITRLLTHGRLGTFAQGAVQGFAGNGDLFCAGRNVKLDVLPGVDGQRSGLSLTFYPDGSICDLRYLKAGKREVTFSCYPDGTCKSLATYKNDKRSGIFVLFHPNGKLLGLAETDDGVVHGQLTIVDSNGTVATVLIHNAGNIVSRQPKINDDKRIKELQKLFADSDSTYCATMWKKALANLPAK